MFENDFFFWVFWFLTVLICCWEIMQGIRMPRRCLELPFIWCLIWLFLYGAMPLGAALYLTGFLPPGYLAKGQLFPLLSLVGALVGFRVGKKSKQQGNITTYSCSLSGLWKVGLTLVFVGILGTYSLVYSAGSMLFIPGGRLDWEQMSAYWYMLYFVGYPGIGIMLWVLLKGYSRNRVFRRLIFYILGFIFIFPYVYNARRGPLFPFAVFLLFVPIFAPTIKPRRFRLFACLIITGILMLCFIQVRTWLYTGGTWSQAINNLTIEEIALGKTKQLFDNEFINNCLLIATVSNSGNYQYGLAHLSLLTHWIPRAVWPNKPTLGYGQHESNLLLFDTIESDTGFRFLGGGAAAGGVADSFVQYGYFTPFFWFLLGWLNGWLFRKSLAMQDPRWQFSYVSSIGVSHWLISQGFVAAFFPMVIFHVISWAAFGIVKKRKLFRP